MRHLRPLLAALVVLLSVACPSLLQWLIVPRLRPLAAGKSKATFSTFSVRTSDAVHQIQEGQADFAVVRKDSVPRGVKSAPLGRLSFGGAYPRAFAKAEPVTIKQFLAMPLAVMTTDGQFTGRLRAIAKAQSIYISPAIACQSFPQVLSAVQSGSYAAVIPTIAINQLDTAKFRTILPEDFKALARDLVLIWNQRTVDVRPGAAAVLEFLTETLVL